MGSGEGPVMARIHSLQHIEGFSPADFAHDDTIRPHTEGILYEITDGNGPFAFDIGRTGFQSHHMRLLKSKFGSIFNGYDSFVRRNKRRKYIQRRRFPGTGTPADEDIQPGFHAGPEENSHIFIKGSKGNEIFHGKRILGEFTDGHAGTDEGKGRNHHIHSGTIRKSGIHKR
jgi:hypothetical protein